MDTSPHRKKDLLVPLNRSLGGSAYIVDPSVLRKNVTELLAAFREIYPRTSIGYSYKTNYLPVLTREADALGCYAEVVSGAEYEIAKLCGIAPKRIIFNGPIKTSAELKTALADGALVNVDSLQEIDTLTDVCAQPDCRNRQFTIGVRCGFELHGNDTRFGIRDSNGDLAEAFRRLDRIPNCSVTGLHCHFSSQRSPESYRERAVRMIEFANTFFPDSPPRFIDLGGGMQGPMPNSLARQLGDTSSYEDYASAVAPVLAERYPSEDGPELILEPGVGIVSNTMKFACKVEATKELSRRNVAVVSGSYQNIKPRISDFNHPIQVIPTSAEESGGVIHGCDFVGYTCMEDDTLYSNYEGEVRVGDIVVFENIGAYSMVFNPPFIRPIPPVVMWSASLCEWVVVKSAQEPGNMISDCVLEPEYSVHTRVPD